MASFILLWNPKRWEWPEADLRRTVRRTRQGKPVSDQWSTGNRKSGICVGDRCFLLRQGSERGLIGAAFATSEISSQPHWDGTRNRVANFIDIDWELLVDVDHRLPVEVLHAEVPEVSWDRLQSSGIRVPDAAAARLEDLWSDHTGVPPYRSPEEMVPGHYPEGAAKSVTVNRYERDRRARQACIVHWGVACSVCGFDFASRYGAIGKGFIHVHHLHDLSTVGDDYQVDPIKDLRPVCPNCHAMLHTRRPAHTISELRSRLRST